MASSAPWLRWTQTDLGAGCEELKRWEEEEEEEEDFERHMDENGVIGLEEDGLVAVTSRPGSSRFGEAPAGSMDLSDLQDSGSEEWGREDAGSPASGDGEELDEGSPVEPARWHPRQDLTEEEEEEEEEEEGEEEEEEQGSSMEDEQLEGPWGAESDGELHPEAGPLQKALGVTTDGGDTLGPSDTSPSPATPPRRRRSWGRAGDTHGSLGQGWGPGQSRSAPQNTAGSRAEPSPKPGPLGSPQTPHQRPRVPEPGRLSRPLSPRRHAGAKKPKDATEGCRYGRGQLNHPLPDLSKVEARVKFDQSYRPPPSRALPARARTPGGPLVLKSPAEIVREVLLSSGEGAPPQPPAPPGVPQELRSPRQATALVQQLQDDYHKLLTKYAEAENTIDQLRLGAKVSLYADPPRASRSAHAGTLGSGCRVMAFSIPRASAATVSTAPNPNPAPTPPLSVDGDLGPGPAGWGLSPRPRSPLSSLGGCPTCPGQCRCLGPQLTQTLAGQTRKLQAQVESFESWIRAGSAVPQEQLQRFRRLKEAQDALERAYLRAREEHGQQRPAASGDFDPERAVEGEIFCLGMRLEELKERLERAARPPGSPRPQLSPAVTEGPPSTQGTSGDGEVVAAGLPRPLWHKQLRAEEDFGDLLEQYQHFKSLPASLSLEHLSLAGSGSLEEADGPVAGDGGPGQVPCRARSLEEGTDLETSPSPPPQRRAPPLPHGDPLRTEGTRGRRSPTATQEPPAAPRPPPPVLPEPLPPRVPLSRHSSGGGSAATQRHPLKPCRQVLQEQRMVSPETDSGFVGSEASRVSPLVRTPEHRPLGTGTPGSLGPPAPIPVPLRPPQKKDAWPLPPEKALMGTYPSPGHLHPRGGVGGPSLPPSTASHSSSPPRWAESLGSELGPEGDGGEQPAPGAAPRPPPPPSPPPPCSPARSDSEGPQSHFEGGHQPCPVVVMGMGCGAGAAPGAVSPPLTLPVTLSRAIRALRDEVWRLRRRLEESLRRSRSYPEGKAAPRSAQARRQPAASGPSSPRDAAHAGEPSPPARGRVAPAAVTRVRSASLPRDRTELDLSSESGRSLAGHGDGWHQGTPAAQKRARSPPGTGTVRGQYTGTRYQVPPPATLAPRGEPSTPGCPQCRGSRTASAGSPAGDAVRQPRQSTPRTRRCATCRAPRAVPPPGSRDGAAHELGTDAASSPGSRPRAEPPEQPGLWYLAGGPPVGYLAPVPLVPYAPPLLYCSPAPTSAPAPPQRPPLGLPLADLEELQWSLGRAVEAAQRARRTTKRMGRSLASELSRARGLRGSCLF
ncbi:microtubule organization protein AKNA [Oxyura jamaicensis]|uniref:microtubule organization protein AKNA n=1 Tax=Oxyura jamaicensis TaxID=8884 RepID=UPI0015A53CA9|nr:microtubule organization protein AKNA [Oxyura jamaicensis]